MAPYVKPQLRMVFDLVSDPHETMDLVQADLTIGWVVGPGLARIIARARSQPQYPIIAPGADFEGYDRWGRSGADD